MRAPLLGLLLSLTLAAPAAADDACLTGDATLGDQRALVTLRTSTETSCPCAGAASRGSWRRCARGVLTQAIDGGTLRLECKRTAKKINTGAVCGSTKVACGRFKATADDPRTCRVRRPASCHDRTRYDETACTAETHCADVVDWTASTCVDARDNGPYVPGARVVTFNRPSTLRYCSGGTGACNAQPLGPNCICNADSACQSNVCATKNRVLDTVVWYPATAGSSPITNSYAAVLNAPIETSAAPWPTVLFSHGSCGYPQQSTFLTALLASYGFIVVAPPHPGNTIFDGAACGNGQAIAAAAIERPADVRFVLDQMLLATADVGSPFYGAVDETRVGMSGHSFGGFTTYVVIEQDSRFRVAIPMAPAVPPSHTLDVPSLTMLGQVDSVVDVDAIRTAYADSQPPKYKVEIAHAGHYAFSNGCFPSADCDPPTTLTQDEAHNLVRRYVLPFLELYLVGDASFQPFLVPPAATGTELDVGS